MRKIETVLRVVEPSLCSNNAVYEKVYLVWDENGQIILGTTNKSEAEWYADGADFDQWIRCNRESFATDEDWEEICAAGGLDPNAAQFIKIHYTKIECVDIGEIE